MDFNYPMVSIIILNWNGWEDTLECLESVYRISYPNYQVILVDNSSEDDSLEQIHAYCEGKLPINSSFIDYNPHNKPIKIFEYNENELLKSNTETNTNFRGDETLILIKNNFNHGFAGGNNIGINYALENSPADYILLLNNDTVVAKDFLDNLVKTASSADDVGAVGPKTYFYNNKNMIQWAAGGFIEPEHIKVRNIGSFEDDQGQFDEDLELDFVIASCVLCKRDVIEKVGLLETAYFMYFEDVDWSLRMIKEGYKCFYSYQSKIWHKMGKSSTDCFKTYYYHRNRINVVKKNYTSREYRHYLLNYLIKDFPRENLDFLKVLGYNNYFNCYFKGVISGIFKKIR